MTHALVVFESMFGNTRKIAEAVADGLRTAMPVELTEGIAHPPVAAFDTKISRPRLPGSAARAARNRLRRAGFPAVLPAENFYVQGTPGPLVDGELARARAWGERLGRHARARHTG
jgi:hypothetical protein